MSQAPTKKGLLPGLAISFSTLESKKAFFRRSFTLTSMGFEASFLSSGLSSEDSSSSSFEEDSSSCCFFCSSSVWPHSSITAGVSSRIQPSLRPWCNKFLFLWLIPSPPPPSVTSIPFTLNNPTGLGTRTAAAQQGKQPAPLAVAFFQAPTSFPLPTFLSLVFSSISTPWTQPSWWCSGQPSSRPLSLLFWTSGIAALFCFLASLDFLPLPSRKKGSHSGCPGLSSGKSGPSFRLTGSSTYWPLLILLMLLLKLEKRIECIRLANRFLSQIVSKSFCCFLFKICVLPVHAGKCEVFSLLSAACVWEQTPVEHSCRKTFPWPLQEKNSEFQVHCFSGFCYNNTKTSIQSIQINELFSTLTSLNCDKRWASREQKFKRRMWYHQTPFPGELSLGETSWWFFLQLLLKLACHTARFMPANDAAFSQAFWQSKVRLRSNIFSFVMSSRMTMSASLQMRAGHQGNIEPFFLSKQRSTSPHRSSYTPWRYDCFSCQNFFYADQGLLSGIASAGISADFFFCFFAADLSEVAGLFTWAAGLLKFGNFFLEHFQRRALFQALLNWMLLVLLPLARPSFAWLLAFPK